MQTTRLEITPNPGSSLFRGEVEVTFRHFISYLEKRVVEENSVKKNFFAYVLRKFKAKKELRETVSLENISKYKDELTLLYSLLMPVISKEKEEYWALAAPVTPIVFYGTNTFYDLLRDDSTGTIKCNFSSQVLDKQQESRKVQHIYSFILHKLYNYHLPSQHEMLLTIPDEVTRMPRYFTVSIDTRFVEVFAREELPEIHFEKMQQQQDLQGHFDWETLYKILPLSKLRFEGFTILCLKDITSTQALENIKSIILNRSETEDSEYYQKVRLSLQVLAESSDIMFDLLPCLRINNKLVFDDQASQESLLVKTNLKSGNSESQLSDMAEMYLRNPKVLFYRKLTAEDVDQVPVLEPIRNAGVVSYALIPVYYNNNVAGVLEVFSHKPDLLNETVLSRMEAATPLLAQLLQKSIEHFNSKIQSVITERFTSLQPAVQWKFNEVAWHHLRHEERGDKNGVQNILFKDVYPLYAAVDIRNSTLERNDALKSDLGIQLNLVIAAAREINKVQNIAIADELIFKCQKWLKSIEEQPMEEYQTFIRDFLDYEVNDFLSHFKSSDSTLAPIVANYFDEINEETGSAFENRRALEISIQQINSAINKYLEVFKAGVQESYPWYFEKFRTDGVEFDMYIGQSIAPEKPFNILYLKNLRLWQLNAMAAISTLTQQLLPTLSKPLQTTQLIFIHSNSIDISFRNDERRFDVEGGYNIRYQVIKKRIDKVTIKRTNERLTQPGKIAMVYFNKKEADEYVEYISYLQNKNVLLPGIEYLDLEELQGVSGLKALRVDVNTEVA